MVLGSNPNIFIFINSVCYRGYNLIGKIFVLHTKSIGSNPVFSIMKFIVFKDKTLRNRVKIFEKRRKIILFLLKNKNLTKKLYFSISICFNSLTTHPYKTRIQNRCILTGNSKSVSRLYRVSRIPLKYLLFFKYYEGTSKATW